MKMKVTNQGLLLPREWFGAFDEADVRQENGRIVVEPGDASVNHDDESHSTNAESSMRLFVDRLVGLAAELGVDTSDLPTDLVENRDRFLQSILEADRPSFSPKAARKILTWEFSADDLSYMHELLEKAKAGTLTKSEKLAADNYERLGHILSMLRSEARLSLRNSANGR
jgi:hypothetical protein